MSGVIDGSIRRKLLRRSKALPAEKGAGLIPRSQDPAGKPDSPRRIPRDATLRRAVRNRMSSTVDALIVATCTTVIEKRLGALQPTARASMVPPAATRAETADRIIADLPRTILIGLLAPEIEMERRALMEFACCANPMLREAALDALGQIDRPDSLERAVQDACVPLLEPRLALLGATVPTDQAEAIVATASPAANEASVLSALERDERDLVARTFAAHAAVDPKLVHRAIRCLDARAVLALAWRAGYSARTALLLQTLLLGVSPQGEMRPDDMGYNPTVRGEMAWQLALLSDESSSLRGADQGSGTA